MFEREVSTEGEYDGNDLVVRIYKNWKNEPDKYEKIAIKISNNDKAVLSEYELPVFIVCFRRIKEFFKLFTFFY